MGIPPAFANITDVGGFGNSGHIKGDVQDDNGLVNNQKIELYEITPASTNGTLVASVLTGPSSIGSLSTGNGEYRFTDVPAGEYRVAQVDLSTGIIQTLPVNGQPHFIEIVSSQIINNIDFVDTVAPTSDIEGIVWDDQTPDGIKDSFELGVENITVCINPIYQCVLTDTQGRYIFSNVPITDYVVYVNPVFPTISTTPNYQQISVLPAVDVDFGISTPEQLHPEVTVVGVTNFYGDAPVVHFQQPTTYTKNVGPLIGFDHCGSDKPVEIKLLIEFTETGNSVEQMMQISGDPADEIWEAYFAPFNPEHGLANMTFYVDCPDNLGNGTPGFPEDHSEVIGNNEIQTAGNIYIDPSGIILTSCDDNPSDNVNSPLSGSIVTLLKEFPPGTGSFVTPNTSDHIPTQNPQTTSSDGSYGWAVTPGNYKLKVDHSGYHQHLSNVLTIPPAVTDHNIELDLKKFCSNITTVELPLVEILPLNNLNSSTILKITPNEETYVFPEVLFPVTFQFMETNDGDSPLTNVSVSTDDCMPIDLVDDGNGDLILDPGETWIYECERYLAQGHNTITAIATGTDQSGLEITHPLDPDESATAIVTGGCLIATATYGTELAPQVQMLREIRDNTLFSTESGTSFMESFNTAYYSFAPTISDWERESPLFKEAVKLYITPMLSTLSIMSLAEDGSEIEVLGWGISVIALNLGMYFAAPAFIGIKSYKHFKSRK